MKHLHKIDFKRAKKAIKLWFGFAIISLMTLGFVWLTIIFPLSFERFNVAQNIFEQYNLIDTYFTIHKNGKNVENLDSTIVIIDINGCGDRDTIAKYLDIIQLASPKAIGVDILFNNPYNCSDTSLVRVLSEMPNLTVVNYLDLPIDNTWNQYQEKQESFSECIDKPLNSGFSNLSIDNGFSSTYRRFAHCMFLNQDTVQSFASAIAQIAMPNEYKTLIHRNKEIEYINFNNADFEIIIATDIDTLLKKKPSFLKDKIVIINDLDGCEDKHITPINSQMSGAEIHAYILSTIKNGNYIDIMPEAVAWILAFLIIMLLVAFKYWITNKNEWWALFMPVFQLIIILLDIFIGYYLFVKFNRYIPVMQILIGIAIAGFPYDLYFKIIKTIHKHKKI